eukprot:CAMPEP_0113955884 /NCGR_PEP_ID=MMETSP0011_2-20120614/1686_1 /TAXON_ID=101924 /ORGANISM="Rhodosorus marinus" /LENGTH=223 /DNA_ID=CAMNT_0000965833 /DNA_START=12 /DNA_END=686 /DNA_ORIENTATION=- /assembly_acc=CAM_ASM_000156
MTFVNVSGGFSGRRLRCSTATDDGRRRNVRALERRDFGFPEAAGEGEKQQVDDFQKTRQDSGFERKIYTIVPLDDNGVPMVRVLIVGSAERDLKLAKLIKDSPSVTGLYYTCDRGEALCDVEMSKVANTVPGKSSDEEAWIGFCIWAKVNIVFLGAGKQVSNRDKIEKSLSERGVTFYGSDVSQALVDDTISLDSCLQAPIEQLEEALPALRRAAEELTARGD